MGNRRRTYFSDVSLRSMHVGIVPPSPSIGQVSANSPSRTDIPAHLLLISTPMTIGPGNDSTPAAAAVIASSGTITTASSNNRVAPTGNVTSVVLQAPQVGTTATGGTGTSDGDFVLVTNESAFTLTFATDATSNVFNGSSVTVPAKSAVPFVWDPMLNTGAGLWVAATSGISNLSGNQAISGNLVVTSNSANALTAGPNGTTNPTLNVNANTASAATGLQIIGAAAGGGLAVSVITSGTNENLTLDAASAGTITLNGTGTGVVTVGHGLAVTGTITGTTASATALTIGRQGSTNPALLVDASTATSVTGIKIKSAAATAGVALSVITSGTNENLTIDAASAGTITLNGTGTGLTTIGHSLGVTGTTTGTSASANALAVGLNGATNPAFNVDASTASSATGLNIKSAAAAAGLAVSVISSGSAENLTVDAKGAGLLTIGGTSTGIVSVGRGSTSTAVFSSTLTTIATQNAAPTAANLLGGFVAHATTTGTGTFTLPTGTQMSTAISGVTAGDTFDFIMANTGTQTSTITQGSAGFTLIGATVAITTGKTAVVYCRNTGANTWVAYVVAAQ
jgi:hypothetical protein